MDDTDLTTGGGGDTVPQVTLPEVVVTPNPSPSDVMTAGTGGGTPGYNRDFSLAPTGPQTLSDGAVAARLEGYDWPAIDSHIADFQNNAAQWGYDQKDVDSAVGKLAPLDQFGPLPYTDLHLDPRFPTQDVNRPFAPGEYMTNPDGSWSSEMSYTTDIDGKPTVVPGLWLMNGKPTHLNEDQAAEQAQSSGLNFQSFPSEEEADAFSEQREQQWQKTQPGDASVPSLWTGKVFPPGLPSPHDAVDWPIGTIQGANLTPTVPLVRQTQANMITMQQQSGIAMRDLYAASHVDPLLQDVLTSTPSPDDPVGHMARQTINAWHQEQARTPTAPTLQDIHNNDVGLQQWYVPGEDILHEKTIGGMLKTAGLDAAMLVGGPLVSKYVFAPLGAQILKHVGPAFEDIADTLKGVISDEAGSIGMGRSVRRPPLPTAPSGIDWTAERGGFTNLEDALHRLQTQTTADRRALGKIVNALPKEWRTKEFQENAYNYQETMNPLDSTFKRDADIETYLDHVEPLLQRERELAIEVNRKLHGAMQDYDPTLQITSNREGYIHRLRDEKEVNPVTQDTLGNEGGTRSLSRWASSMQERQHAFVLDNGQGQRVWGGDELPTKAGWKFGDSRPDPVTGQNWHLAPATTKEIEANGKLPDGTSPKFIKNHIISLAENVARLSEVNRSLDFLAQGGQELEAQGQFIHALEPAKPIGRTFDGRIIFSSNATPKSKLPPDFKEVTIPSLEGWASPRVADALNQFWHSVTPAPTLDWLRKTNRAVINLLFMNPLIHGLNETTQYFMNRGWDNFNPFTYGRALRLTAKAYSEVKNFGPLYEEHLREGTGSLQFARQETQNFLQMLHDKMIDTQSKAPWFERLATKMLDSIQHPYENGKDAVSKVIGAQLKWSHRTMWQWNDILSLSRQLEYREKGMSVREAIFQAEKDISNYRVPSQVFKSDTVSRFITDPAYDNFGRYHYGLVRSAVLMANDFVRGTMGDRLDAVGKGLSLALGAMGVLPLLSYGITAAGRAITGDQNFKAQMMPSGILSPMMAFTRSFTQPQSGWLGAVGSIASVNPILSTLFQLAIDRDVFGRQIFENKTLMGKIAAAAEIAGNNIYPLQVAMSAFRKGGLENAIGAILHFKRPVDPADATKWQKRQLEENYSQERNDGFEQWLTGIFGGGPPPLKGRSTGGSGRRNRLGPGY